MKWIIEVEIRKNHLDPDDSNDNMEYRVYTFEGSKAKVESEIENIKYNVDNVFLCYATEFNIWWSSHSTAHLPFNA